MIPTRCWQCGLFKEVNSYGICADCWEERAYLRERGLKTDED